MWYQEYSPWHFQPANTDHGDRYTMDWRFGPSSARHKTYWVFWYPTNKSDSSGEPMQGWCYYYNPQGNYYVWRCRTIYHPEYDPLGMNWCRRQGSGWSNQMMENPPIPDDPDRSDRVGDPPNPPPIGAFPPTP